eukprot:scaffold4659_cov73-Attheya_sp.AAC.5
MTDDLRFFFIDCALVVHHHYLMLSAAVKPDWCGQVGRSCCTEQDQSKTQSMSKTGLKFLDEIEAAVKVPKEAPDACYILVVLRRDVWLIILQDIDFAHDKVNKLEPEQAAFQIVLEDSSKVQVGPKLQ